MTIWEGRGHWSDCWVAYGLTRCNGFIIKVSDKSIMVLLQLVSLVLKRFTLIIHQERRTSEDRVRTVYRGAALSVFVVIRKVWQTWREQGHKGHCQPSNPVGKGGTSTMHAMLRLLRSFSLVVHIGMCSVFVRQAWRGQGSLGTMIARQARTCRRTPRWCAPSTLISQADP